MSAVVVSAVDSGSFNLYTRLELVHHHLSALTEPTSSSPSIHSPSIHPHPSPAVAAESSTPRYFTVLHTCTPYVHRYKETITTHTHPFNGPFSGTTRVSRYQKGKTNLDYTEARDSEWQWHQLGHMQVCTSLQTNNHASTPQLSFLQAGCPSRPPTNSVKALKAGIRRQYTVKWSMLLMQLTKIL